ncbi:MAG: OsmC family protein [Actinobacteria bacterium]|nr:OsmC family protein [Actinomycetota bacterium]
MAEHHYATSLAWTGDTGAGTRSHRSYDRSHRISAEGKPDLLCSSDPAFRGDPARWNPEDLLVAALSGCHMLWYLHLCADAGVVVTGYEDDAAGTMVDHDEGGEFTSVVLRPVVRVADAGMVADAERLHAEAHRRCFVARSVNFPVTHEPTVTVAPA